MADIYIETRSSQAGMIIPPFSLDEVWIFLELLDSS